MDKKNDPLVPPPRRRLSLFSKARARPKKISMESGVNTACRGIGDATRAPDHGAESIKTVDNDAASDRETSGAARPTTSAPRKPRASFSGFNRAVNDIRTFPERFASQRRKPPAGLMQSNIEYTFQDMTSVDEKSIANSSIWDEGVHPHPPPKSAGWLRRCMSTTLRHRRRTSGLSSRPSTALWTKDDTFFLPLPPLGVTPPMLPENTSGGAAARAAAAAQNEMLDYMRRIRAKERRVREDSESGIGIDTRPAEIESTVIRRDPSKALPKELFTLILIHLDSQSLISSELVSRHWHVTASEPLMWKQIFLADFQPLSQTIPETSTDFHTRGQGMGNGQADQDWKRMWKVRKALHQRWKDGHAAAIYLEGHHDSVYCVQFDEDKILTGSRDRTIRVWDAHTFRLRKILGVPFKSTPVALPPIPKIKGHNPHTIEIAKHFIPEQLPTKPNIFHRGSILCLQYDDDLMITGSSDHTCIMWNIKDDWKPIRQVHYHTAGVLDVCFDEKHIVSCSKDTTVCLWDRQTGDLVHRLHGHRGPVNAVQLRGNLAVSASGDGVAKLWNLPSGNCIKEFPSKYRGMACVEFSPDSLTIFAGGNDHVIYQFDASTGELVREIKGHGALVRSLHLDSATGRIASGSYDTSIRAHDIRTGEPVVELTGWTASWILSAKLDYRRIVATSQDSRAVVVDFGYHLPGVELLESRYCPVTSHLGENIARLRLDE
ncbi:MAG: hypothetical protein Q9222_002603 [Ikaeria aurantiellina]